MVRQTTLTITLILLLFTAPGYQSAKIRTINDNGQVQIDKNTVFSGVFNDQFGTDEWMQSWGLPWYHCAADCKTIPGGFNGNHSVRVKYPAGSVGPGEGGAQFPVVFTEIPEMDGSHFNEGFLSYYLKFEEGFDFRLGGKLPGLMGGGNSWARSGGNQPDGTNGWTLRFMWRRNGQLVIYAYVPPSGNGKWGSERWGQSIDCNFIAKPGKWHRIEQYVDAGTPGKDDGKLKVWIDGEKKLAIDDMRFWETEGDHGKIGGIYFSTFHGGNSENWAPLHDSYMQFADFSFWKK